MELGIISVDNQNFHFQSMEEKVKIKVVQHGNGRTEGGRINLGERSKPAKKLT